MSFEIRAMTEQDLDGVFQLAAASIEAPLWTRDDYAQALPSAPATLLNAASWTAQSDGRLVGFAVVRWLRGEAAAEIENLVVERQHRRQGIGTAFIKACTEWATRAGASAVRLEVRESNASALALYRALGFVSAGVRRAYYSSPVEDALLLEHPATLKTPSPL